MDRITPERRSLNMRSIPGKNTAPEMLVRRLVHGMGFRYKLHVTKLPGRPDLVFPRLRKIIQVQGCFWHQHEGCRQAHLPQSRVDYWHAKLANTKRRDDATEMLLRAHGWDVLTLWECELRNSPALPELIRRYLTGPSSEADVSKRFAKRALAETQSLP